MERTIIIQASSRPKGDTHKITTYITNKYSVDTIDLYHKNISHYDYEYRNKDDDFLEVVTGIIKNYDTIIFATPVYWYTMSGILKVFFDRLSDLIRIHKDLGRQLRGKNMGMISINNSNEAIEGFSLPFEKSAEYLGMNYLNHIHTWVENDAITNDAKLIIDDYLEEIKRKI